MSLFSTRPKRVQPGPAQESVWDYPRPPRLEPVTARLVVVLGGEAIAETTRGYRVLETSHPPNYYLPPGDVAPGALERSAYGTSCEFKGAANYYTVRGGDRVEATRPGGTTDRARVSSRSRAASRSTPGAWTPASSTGSV